MAMQVMQQTTPPSHRLATKYVGEMSVRPKGCPSLLLGTFAPDESPLGFKVLIHPNPKPAGSVTTSVALIDGPDNYKLILRVTNNGTKTVGIEAHQLLDKDR